MKTPEKQTKIQRLEKSRNSKVITYITGDKPGFQAQISSDVIPILSTHLKTIGPTKKISFFLYSQGGSLEAPWPIVNLIREYCQEFEVILPYKALSAATLMCLAADRIIMTPKSQLSPIDPMGTFITAENKMEQIQIEDVIGYVEFAKNKIGIAEQSALAQVLNNLSASIKPTIIGSINRTHHLIRRLAENSLRLHKKRLEEKQIQEIVQNLSEKLYSHQHVINRKEAKDLIGFGDIISYSSSTDENLIDEIFDEYSKKLQLSEDFNPVEFLGAEMEKDLELKRALIESEALKNSFVSKYKVSKLPTPTGEVAINLNNFYNKWEEKDE